MGNYHMKFGCIDALKDIPDSPGVYKVIVPEQFGTIDSKDFEQPTFAGGEEPLDLDAVRKKYDGVKGTSVLYIGKASNLRRRIRQFINYGNGNAKNHRGGRFIFAIKDWGNLELEIKVCKSKEKAAERESELINEFKDEHDQKLPFANRIGGKRIKDKSI